MLFWLTSVALAYEVDPWTPRGVLLADALPAANSAFEDLLDEAAASTRCAVDEAVLQRRLARRIRKLSAQRVWLRRPGLARFGHGRYSGWLETAADVPRVTTGNDGVFREVRLIDAFVLHAAGTASTVRLGDVWLGTDKVDHFLATGFSYLRWSRWGRVPQRALRRGERTERTLLGQWTSRAFSYADLAANWDGLRFYQTLLGPEGPFQTTPEGCVARRGRWDWADWVHPDWDELNNPSVYGPRVQRRLTEALAPDRDALCGVFRPLPQRVETSLRAPQVEGPMGLAGFCAQTTAPSRSAETTDQRSRASSATTGK